MDDTKAKLPLTVAAASGIGGVAPPVSVLAEPRGMQETAREGLKALAIIPVCSAGNFDAALAEASGMLSCAFNHYATRPIHFTRFNEALRKSFEQSMQFFDEMIVANGPIDLLKLQLGFLSMQVNQFSDHMKDLQREIFDFFSPR